MSESQIDVAAPLPEALDGEVWKLSNGLEARMSFNPRHMVTPQTDSPRDRFLRLHEMGHAKWTPRTTDPKKETAKVGVPWEYIQAAEDLRINHRLSVNAKFMDLSGTMTKEEAELFVSRCLEQPDPLTPITLQLAATQNTKDFTLLQDALDAQVVTANNAAREAGAGRDVAASGKAAERFRVATHVSKQSKRIVMSAHYLLVAENPSNVDFKRTRLVARYLYDLIGSTDKRPKKPASSPGLATESKTEAAPDPSDDPEMQKLREVLEKTHRGSANKWGTCEVRKLPLTVTNKVAVTGRRIRATDHGAVPRYMHRLLTDQRVFGYKMRGKGGTLVIDVSGSMHLPPEAIDKVLETAPCATVAIYSGMGNGGYLSIVAKNGHRASQETIRRAITEQGDGNIVDGPALMWLKKQEGPRIWVCDGQVTGCGDGLCPVLTAEALHLVKVGGIKRIGDMTSAVDYFTQLVKGRANHVTGW